MGIEIQIQLEEEAYAPSDEVRGLINVLEGDEARWVEVSINQVEVTADYTDIVRSLSVGQVHQGPLATGMAIPFSAPLPPDAKPNFLGPGSIVWRIDVEVDRRGFNVKTSEPINIVRREGVERPPLPPNAPVHAGGAQARGGGIPIWLPVALGLLLVAGLALFGWRKLATYDDPLLPANLKQALFEEFGEATWFGSITSVEGDDPDPGDMTLETTLSPGKASTSTAQAMCNPLLGYLEDHGADDPTIFIHSTEVLESWVCDDSGAREF
jgi:hypothetical protein